MIQLAIDYEHSDRTWWDAGGRDLWEMLLDEPDAGNVVLDDGVAESWLVQAAALPGWHDTGHEYAPHPIRASPADPEDMDAS
jgi:hypothetical protein